MATKLITKRTQAVGLAATYPWFNHPLRFLSANCGEALPARIIIADRIRPGLRNTVITDPSSSSANNTVTEPCDINVAGIDTNDNLSFMSIIDEFIEKNDYKISVDDSTPDDVSLVADSGLLPEDELLTEELAAIYSTQGLKEEAIEIYRRLSLLNPEKSIYFAKLIAKVKSAVN